jgi:hypothetical protein
MKINADDALSKTSNLAAVVVVARDEDRDF